jgi:hypothetical protein
MRERGLIEEVAYIAWEMAVREATDAGFSEKEVYEYAAIMKEQAIRRCKED